VRHLIDECRGLQTRLISLLLEQLRLGLRDTGGEREYQSSRMRTLVPIGPQGLRDRGGGHVSTNRVFLFFYYSPAFGSQGLGLRDSYCKASPRPYPSVMLDSMGIGAVL
jgi:hypothetical protein